MEHEFLCLGCLYSQGNKGKKMDFRFSEQLLRVVFSTFCGQFKKKKNIKTIVESALKPYIAIKVRSNNETFRKYFILGSHLAWADQSQTFIFQIC